jgi:hypothetical protein
MQPGETIKVREPPRKMQFEICLRYILEWMIFPGKTTHFDMIFPLEFDEILPEVNERLQ